METADTPLAQRAERLLYALFDAAGDGCHSITASGGAAWAQIPFHNRGHRTHLGNQLTDAVTTMSPALDSEVCGIVLRTHEDDGTSRVRAWKLAADTLTPLTVDALRLAYAFDPETGEPLPATDDRFEEASWLHLH
ncbi:hypothetical protein [Streptomyces sp. NPDC060031]|uniref:hypothetical protein n=1 Tax=Streptomyces sp. NPDC060031 TaxID=3347043 RepID=UPI003699D175